MNRPLADRLRTALEELAPQEPPVRARRGAVLVLLEPDPDDPAAGRLLYTRRQPHLSSHPGQISFPGGRVEPAETVQQAALREAQEEVGVEPGSVLVLGRLPAFYIPPSRYWMSAVVAAWHAPHPLVPQESEVAEILHVHTATLRDPDRWRSVQLSAAGASWAWQLGPRQLLWGATAVVTGVLMDLLDPRWSGGVRPQDLPEDRQVRPWEQPELVGLERVTGVQRQALPGVRTVEVPPPEAVGATTGSQSPPTQQAIDRWAAGVAEAVRLLRERELTRGSATAEGPVVVLVGPGTIGRIGRRVVELLEGAGADVVAPQDVELDVLADAGVIVDALLGRGLRGLLADPLLSVVRQLQGVAAPIVAVDLPTGIDPVHGLVGETVSADVTVTDATLVPGHVAAGAMPFVSDLYVVDDRAALRRANVVSRPADWGE